MMRGEENVDPESLGDLEALSGVRKFPVRVKCATPARGTRWKKHSKEADSAPSVRRPEQRCYIEGPQSTRR